VLVDGSQHRLQQILQSRCLTPGPVLSSALLCAKQTTAVTALVALDEAVAAVPALHLLGGEH
jgi:hypothetical protein